jgi:DNA-binding LacI/PurR family transcriptional regulator
MALGLLRALSERSIRVPRDVSVVGFDDIPESEFFLPPLTTMRQDFGELGRRALRLLVDRINDDEASPGVPVAAELVVRASASQPGP